MTTEYFESSGRNSSSAIHCFLASAVVLLAASQAVGVAPGCVPAPSGLVSWWRGEDSTADATGGSSGTIAGTVTYGTGIVGQAFVFDGTHRDRIDLGNPASLQLENFTLEAWVKRSSPTVATFDILGVDGSVCGDGACIIGYGRGGYIFALANDGRLILSRTDIDGLFSTPLVTDTEWHHLAVTKSASGAVFYVDGLPQPTPAYVHPDPYTFDDATCACSAAVAIGSRGDARGGTFYGRIDEPAVFNRALSASEIQSLYAAGSAGMCVPTPTPVCVPAPGGLISWWRAEGNASDSADNNPGTLLNGASLSLGRVGQAFNLNGSNQCVQVPYTPSLVTSTYSVEAWVKPLAQVSGFISQALIFGQSFGHCQLVARTGGAGVRVAFQFAIDYYTFPEVVSTMEIPIGQFSHLVGTWDGATLRLYINGVLNAQSTPGVSPIDSGCPFFIGGFYSPAAGSCSYVGQFFDGLIDEVSLYRRALLGDEIQSLYAAGSAGKCAPVLPPVCVAAPGNLVSWWRGEGGADDAAGANHGTLLNGAALAQGTVGQGFHLDGSNQCVQIPCSPSLIASNYSVETWIKPAAQVSDSTRQDLIFGQSFGHCQLAVRTGTLGLRIAWQFGTSHYTFYGVVSTSEIPIGQFTHLAGTWDGATLRLYINGVLSAQNTPGALPADSGCPFFLGGFYNPAPDNCQYVGQFFNGLVDELSVYNRALSGAEIQSIYSAGSAGKCHEPPTILTPPVSQKVTVGQKAAFNVVASGTPPLRYQWRFNDHDLPDAIASTLSFAVGDASGGSYSVLVTNAFGAITSVHAVLEVNHPPVADASATQTLAISANNTNATVVLDGSRSLDADGDPLQYHWFEAGTANPLAAGVVAAATLPVGSNALTLNVNDGLATSSQTFAVEVITPAQAVERLVALVEAGAPRSHPLIATLSAAVAAIDRSNPTAAINQLQAFQNQLRAQVLPLAPELAETFIQTAQKIIDALVGTSKARGKITLVSRESGGTTWLKGEVPLGARCIIEASTNLLDWEQVGVTTGNAAGAFVFVERNSSPLSARFYRVVSP